ncbi:MAG: alpha/beta hydrolase [Saprospiraceae bacterium]|nr:alpha/beta hydrolase [Saprospiraceae bacterium]
MDKHFYILTSVGKLRVFQKHKFENRPVIVFLHDSLGCIELWRDFPEKLCNKVKCNLLIYDRQGYGTSSGLSNPVRGNSYLETEADILKEILTSLNIKDIILSGHSDGGSIALIYGAKYPEGVSGIITEGAHIFVENETISGIKAALEIYKTTELKLKLEKYHSGNTEAMFRAWTDTWLSEEFRNWNITHFLPQINCPVLAIQGENDEYGTYKQIEGISAKVSGKVSEFIVPNATHSPHNDFPEMLLDVSARFIEGLSG